MNRCQFCLRTTHHIDTCDDCREVFTSPGPAPKEEEMGVELFNMPDDDFDYEQEMKAELDTEARALYREAYMAALAGLLPIATEVDCGIPGIVHDAGIAALETARRWPAMMEELDAVLNPPEAQP